MRLQLLSDLHLETEDFRPQPAPDAELLVLAGDIDSRWGGLERFAGWPVPVLFVAGNHEFDQRELDDAWPRLRARCEALGLRLLERETLTLTDAAGRRIRFVATIRWSDFDLFGASGRSRALRAAGYYVKVMRATRGGAVFDAAAVREEALACRAWLEAALRGPGWVDGVEEANGTLAAVDDVAFVGTDRTDRTDIPEAPVDATVVITHYAPSLRSADPRYGSQPGTASFCNADDDLLPLADLWLHGHLHCRHDYRVTHPPGAPRAFTRVVSNARGHGHKGESQGHDPLMCVEV